MKRVAYEVEVTLVFENLTLEESHNLETFMDGLTSRDEWGTPKVHWSLTPMGEKDPKAPKKTMTAKKLLEVEKEATKR